MSLARFRKPTVLAPEDERVSVVARRLRDERVGCVVVTRDGRPVGLLTDRDIVVRVVAEGRDAERTRVSEIVTYDPFVLAEGDGVDTAAARMREHGIRRLPIVDTRGEVVGIVTADDLLMMLGRQLADVCLGIEEGADSSESR